MFDINKHKEQLLKLLARCNNMPGSLRGVSERLGDTDLWVRTNSRAAVKGTVFTESHLTAEHRAYKLIDGEFVYKPRVERPNKKLFKVDKDQGQSGRNLWLKVNPMYGETVTLGITADEAEKLGKELLEAAQWRRAKDQG